MTLASLHDVWGKNGKESAIQLRLDKRTVATFPYADAAERKDQLKNAEAYIRKAIKDGAAIKLKPGIEEHTNERSD